MKNRLSVVMAVFNEEANLKRCLSAVKNLADEIVIVDGESTDRTVEIAKSFGSKVKLFTYPNPPNFLLNRQRALDKAKGEWVLVLDADEVVSKELALEIETILDGNPVNRAYQIPRLNYFLGRPLHKGGVYPDYVLRLFPNRVGRIPLKSIHDQLELPKEVMVETLKHDLWHYAYPSFQIYLRKWIQYCDHEADLLIGQGKKLGTGLATKYLLWSPVGWFLKTYFRHKGLVDGLPGFIFSLFSALRFVAIYVKLYEKQTS